jgi:peptidoglycan/LPS O-acetylase OafA/YrhL
MSAGRDPGVDAVRAVAIGGVVLGHWLVTAIVLGADGALRAQSPLVAVPALRPASWLFQTLGLFFLAAGFAAAARATRAGGRGARPGRSWRAGRGGLGGRHGRLVLAVAGLLGPLGALLVAGAALGAPEATLHTLGKLAASPLWFLLPYLALTVLARPIVAVVRRVGPLPLVAGGVAVVAAADLGVGVLPLTLCAAWLVPYALGVALALGRLGGRRAAAALLVGGAAVAVALVVAGYPDSAVGVPGDGRSNLNPPSLAAVALGTAQAGAAVLALPWLRRRTSRLVAAVNRRATAIYLWHQPALVAVTVAVAWLTGGRPVDGVLTPPDGSWLALRVAWIAAAVAVAVLAVRLTHARPLRARLARAARAAFADGHPRFPGAPTAGHAVVAPTRPRHTAR